MPRYRPGVTSSPDEVSISSQNRNFPGRSGPGNLYLGSPYSVAASAIAGCVTSWTWLREPRPGNPLECPFAWALIRLDGADSALLHAVDAGSESAMRTGMRVAPRFRDERNGDIHDIACFVPEG